MTRARDLSKFANNQVFSIDSDFQVGINSTVPAATLDVRGNSVITGVLTATSFSGTVDATGLTGSPSITVTDITASGNVSVGGTLTYEDVTNIDAVGVITARSDVSIADKIIHTGDTNTAIRFPAADTFTVETGGSEALRVDSSQRVIIGATSARVVGTNRQFTIEGTDSPTSSASIFRNSDNVSGAVLALGKSRGTSDGSSTVLQSGDQAGAIFFYGADGTDAVSQVGSISAEIDGTPGSNDMPGRLVFNTTADGAASVTERLRITSAGLVKIPDSGKFICGSDDDLEIFHNGSNTKIINGTGRIDIETGTGNIDLLGKDGTEAMAKFIPDGAVELYHNNSKKLETKSDGVDITGELQCDSLDVDGTTHTTGDITAQDSTNFFSQLGNQGRIILKGGESSNFLEGYQSNGTQTVTITNDGNVTLSGTITDSIGSLRRLGITAVSGTGNLSANDAGKLLRSTGTITLTIPSGTFTAGDMITIFNVGTGNITIAQGSSTTLYNSADGATGNRTLAAKGLATIACTASNEFIISGNQLT